MALAAVATRAVDSTRPLLTERRHQLTLSLPAEPVPLDADPVRLEQVLVNLLTNAAKYTEPGGHIDVKVRRDGDSALVQVCDDGVGIAPELLPGMFDLFVQGP